ncbi:MAG TPA: glycosyl hydrolase family 28-related protein [Mycobacterium sp.]|nr:glycosyl hydrolase family 28-related protein [Mycobacterium sp.]
MASGASAVVAGTATAQASVAPVVSRAAIAPALTVGRGANVPFVEQEAENAVTNGTIIGPSTQAYTLAAEASGRSAVSLAPGQYVEFTLPSAANAIDVRYSIPDSTTGGGITAPLGVDVNGNYHRTMTLTSEYSWLYGQYPYDNNPNEGDNVPTDYAVECGCVPAQTVPAPIFAAPWRPNHFYDEQRLLLGRRFPAGSIIRLTAPVGTNASLTTIDLMDSELVGPPKVVAPSVNVLLFGADPTGHRDASEAITRAIAAAQKLHLPVYVPPGTYSVSQHIIVNNVTIDGAGSWYTIFKGHQVTLSTPAPDGSTHTGVGFYGLYVSQGGSTNVHLADFAIQGDVRERIDSDQVNGVGGSLSNSSITGLYIQHTKAGIWLDGPMTNLTISGNTIVDQMADGINFHTGVTNSTASNNFIRNTGDDGIAMWSDQIADSNDTFDHNTVQTPVIANGIALYGGTDNTVSNNLIADPIREGSGIQLGSRFNAVPFSGSDWITNNTTVRAGTYELNWQIGLGAIWIYALQSSINADVEVVGDNFLDNTYDAMMVVSDYPVKDLYDITNVHFRDIEVDGAGTDVFDARSAGSATFQNVDVRNIGWWGVNNCGSFNFPPTGSEFTLTDLGGNDGIDNDAYHLGTNWLTPYLPNAITCNDRPPVVPPPPPSPWVQPVG